MKRIIFILVLFWVQLFLSQNYRVIYEVNFFPKKGIKIIKSELMALDIDLENHKSCFYSLNKVQRDSLVFFKKYKELKKIDKPYLNFIIHKKNTDKKVYCTNMFGYDYCFNTKQLMYWINVDEEISASPGLVDNYKNLKCAITKFSNRSWKAIYTDEVSISEGPYFFSGLPGLILNIQSLDGEYKFNAISIQKIKEIKYNNYQVNIKEGKYKKFMEDFLKNPALYNMIITNEYGDQMNYLFDGKKDINYMKTNQYFKNQFNCYNNPIDDAFPILIFE